MSKRYGTSDESGNGECFAATYQQALGLTTEYDDLSDILGPAVRTARLVRGDKVLVNGRPAIFRGEGVEEFSRGKGQVKFDDDGTRAYFPLAAIVRA